LPVGRSDELAAIYLEFADRFFDGFASEDNPGEKSHDYERALAFYQQALALKPSLARRQQIELRIARCQQELNNLPAATIAYRQFLKSHGTEAEASKRALAA